MHLSPARTYLMFLIHQRVEELAKVPGFSLRLYVGQLILMRFDRILLQIYIMKLVWPQFASRVYSDASTSVNIHTHLHACLLFVFFLLTFSTSYFKSREDISWADHAVFVTYLSSATFCLFCSAFFHMSSSHSNEVCAS